VTTTLVAVGLGPEGGDLLQGLRRPEGTHEIGIRERHLAL
jgi:hypothetical protein